eukprot:m.49226 g.49226  ORF g.49226 m.49226 type:complete len:122 (-) comp12801_c0_seq2:368-733(-)
MFGCTQVPVRFRQWTRLHLRRHPGSPVTSPRPSTPSDSKAKKQSFNPLSLPAMAKLIRTFIHDLKSEPEILPLVSLVGAACIGATVMLARATLYTPEVQLNHGHPNYERTLGDKSDKLKGI